MTPTGPGGPAPPPGRLVLHVAAEVRQAEGHVARLVLRCELRDLARDRVRAVLVEDGRIARIAAAGEFDGFDGEVVDTAGGTLMPGLIDCHVHLCLGAEGDPGTAQDKLMPGQLAVKALERAQQTLAGGVTALRDCGGKDFLEFAARDACNAGRLSP